MELIAFVLRPQAARYLLIISLVLGIGIAVIVSSSETHYPWYFLLGVHLAISLIWVCLWLTLKKLLVDLIGYDAILPVIRWCLVATAIYFSAFVFEIVENEKLATFSTVSVHWQKGFQLIILGIYFIWGWAVLFCPHELFGLRRRYAWAMMLHSVLYAIITILTDSENGHWAIVGPLVAWGAILADILKNIALFQLFHRWAASPDFLTEDPIQRLIDELGEHDVPE